MQPLVEVRIDGECEELPNSVRHHAHCVLTRYNVNNEGVGRPSFEHHTSFYGDRKTMTIMSSHGVSVVDFHEKRAIAIGHCGCFVCIGMSNSRPFPDRFGIAADQRVDEHHAATNHDVLILVRDDLELVVRSHARVLITGGANAETAAIAK